jgi:hypothetical protein
MDRIWSVDPPIKKRDIWFPLDYLFEDFKRGASEIQRVGDWAHKERRSASTLPQTLLSVWCGMKLYRKTPLAVQNKRSVTPVLAPRSDNLEVQEISQRCN